MHAIIDYNVGNLNSVERAFKKVGMKTKITKNSKDIKSAESLILPGVGAFRDSIKSLEDTGLIPLIKEEVKKGKFLIGICIGMQLLFEKSYEYGEYQGLGLMKGDIQKLDISLKIPHMGWNNLVFKKEDSILKYIKENDYVYYVHSYYANSYNNELIAYSEYESLIPAIVRKDNIYGIQFHPEKSADVGLNILKAYKELIK